MNLTDWMLEHLPAELVDECNYYGFAAHLERLLAKAIGGVTCDVCQGAGGWTGLFGRWDPCPKCDPA